MKQLQDLQFLAVLAVLAVVAPGSRAVGVDRDDVRVWLSFEETLEPHYAQGDVEIVFGKGTAEDVAYTAGRRGRGILLKNGVSLNSMAQAGFSGIRKAPPGR